MLDALAMLKDVTNTWPISLGDDGTQAQPYVSPKGFLVVVLPVRDHKVETYFMPDGKMDYRVDDEPIIPVMAGDMTSVTIAVTKEEDANEKEVVPI